MGNILNHNRPIFEIKLSKSEYWDHHIYLSQKGGLATIGDLDEECLSVFIDTNDSDCLEENGLMSKDEYTWENAVNTGVTLNNIGLTGVDNGEITFNKGSITKEEFLDIFTNSSLEIPEDDLRLYVHKVNGNNQIYTYPNDFVTKDGMTVAQLQGGFFQGFFQTDNKCEYQVLPTELGDGWTLEFTLKPEKYESNYTIEHSKYSTEDYSNDGWDGQLSERDYTSGYTGTDYTSNNQLPTLNDMYPANIGTFFYLGARAENKWWKYYVDTEDNTELETADNISLNEQVDTITTDNKFITYNRTPEGYKAFMKDIDEEKVIQMQKQLSTENYFIIMHHGKGGYTARTIKELQQETGADYDILSDLYKNAFAFQIKEDGSIGYKYMVKSCDTESGYEILNEWSNPGTVAYDEWNVIDVRIQPVQSQYSYDMGNVKYMRLLFYVNGKLVLYSKQLPMLDLRMLSDAYSKQEGVPYNISLGGGTQGLCDVIYEDLEEPEYVLFLEKEFGGSFNGYFKSFKFYTCDKNYNQINSNVVYEKKQITIYNK